MKSSELKRLGIPTGQAMQAAHAGLRAAAGDGLGARALRARLEAIVLDPEHGKRDPHFAELAQALIDTAQAQALYRERDEPAPYQQWGTDLEPQSVEQMRNACRLPISMRGALMADAHLGYGLPIGGVLATRGAVIPYAVGVDIACRMKMTVLDLPIASLEERSDELKAAIERETRFGIGAKFKQRRQHDVLDDDWTVSPVTDKLKDKAWSQLGTSGSGNHFVELGVLEIEERRDAEAEGESSLDLEPGTYLALLSHSGSRGTGANVAGHYSKLAMELHPELPRELRHLAWLDLNTEPGEEYWRAMQLMGRYAAANHACIHRHIAEHLGAEVLLDIENHHNYAWEEEHDGETVIVHRKGATPAGKGTIGIIPGSMASSTYIVRGLGNEASLRSASHGAGRVMSRKAAKKRFRWEDVEQLLADNQVTLLSAGIDEVPMVYKNIDEVMAAQSDLVETLARFRPRLVKMAPGGRAED